MKKFLSLILVLQILGVASAFAQTEEDFVKSTQKDLLIVAGGGVGGAIIGLSTLSFTNKPSKHISNVWTGAAIGVIAGVIYVVYDSATRGHEDLTSQVDGKSFETLARRDWHEEKFSLNLTSNASSLVPVWHQEF
jgi:integral membrane sensor domain MASE1